MSFINEIMGCFDCSEFCPSFRLTMSGDKGVYIENVRCIVSYTHKEVILSLKKGGIKICGTDLYIKKYCQGDVVVWGRIKVIERI